MNIKPFFQQVATAVKESQDNNTLTAGDEYSEFLLKLIAKNTETTAEEIDRGEVNTEDLALDLKYTISEFTKALQAVERFNK